MFMTSTTFLYHCCPGASTDLNPVLSPTALIDEDATTQIARVATESFNDAAMVISENKKKAMHVHPTNRVIAMNETEFVALKP